MTPEPSTQVRKNLSTEVTTGQFLACLGRRCL